MAAEREVTVLAAGGERDASQLVAAITGPAVPAGLRARTLGSWPGVHGSAADALEIARAATAEAAAGRGVAIVHGSDTLAETAVLCDLVHGGDAPIVFTDAEGPAELLDAVHAAGAASTTGFGVLVASAGELHAARAGALGRVSGAHVEVWAAPARRPPLPVAQLDARVDVVPAGLGSDGGLVDAALAAGADGLVAVMLGAGHVPPAVLAALRAAAARIPVVACVRPAPDVRAAGLILAPALSPATARITLMACLGAGYSRVATAAAFAPADP